MITQSTLGGLPWQKRDWATWWNKSPVYYFLSSTLFNWHGWSLWITHITFSKPHVSVLASLLAQIRWFQDKHPGDTGMLPLLPPAGPSPSPPGMSHVYEKQSHSGSFIQVSSWNVPPAGPLRAPTFCWGLLWQVWALTMLLGAGPLGFLYICAIVPAVCWSWAPLLQ